MNFHGSTCHHTTNFPIYNLIAFDGWCALSRSHLTTFYPPTQSVSEKKHIKIHELLIKSRCTSLSLKFMKVTNETKYYPFTPSIVALFVDQPVTMTRRVGKWGPITVTFACVHQQLFALLTDNIQVNVMWHVRRCWNLKQKNVCRMKNKQSESVKKCHKIKIDIGFITTLLMGNAVHHQCCNWCAYTWKM